MEQLSFFQTKLSDRFAQQNILNIRDQFDRLSRDNHEAAYVKGRQTALSLSSFTGRKSENTRYDVGLSGRHISSRFTNRYQNIPHQDVHDEVERSLLTMKIDANDVDISVDQQRYGAHLFLILSFPRYYDLNLGAGELFRLQLVVSNDQGRGGLRLMARWYQQENSLSIPVGLSALTGSVAYRIPSQLQNILPTIQRMLTVSRDDIQVFRSWQYRAINPSLVKVWLSGSVRRMWGKRACNFFEEKSVLSGKNLSVMGVVTALAEYASCAKDVLSEYDRLVECSVLMRTLLKQ